MRKVIELEARGHKVTFVCESRGTRSGFAHDAEIFIDHNWWGRATCHYLNRTWESWIFQSACLSCCSGIIEDRMKNLKVCYRENNGISRVAGAHKGKFREICESDPEIVLMKEIKKILNDRCF